VGGGNEMMNSMKHLLSSSAFFIVNKELARQVGLKGAVLLADLISKEEYFISNGMTDGWFFNTAKNIEKDTCLTSHQQRKAIKNLKDLGIIETKVVGIPAKQNFKIMENKLLSYFNTSCEESVKQVVKKTQTSYEESEQLAVKKTQTINKNKGIRINNNTLPEGKGIKEYKTKAQVAEAIRVGDFEYESIPGFLKFWEEFPPRNGVRAGKQEAAVSWIWLKLESDADKILTAVCSLKKTDQWKKDSGKFIPMPVTFLNNRRWEDEVDESHVWKPTLVISA
jgi:hypothetical protein